MRARLSVLGSRNSESGFYQKRDLIGWPVRVFLTALSVAGDR